MWNLIFIAIILYFQYPMIKRFNKIEKGRGRNKSIWINVKGSDAIISHPKFAEVTGITSAAKSKEVSEWTKKEQELWTQVILPQVQKSFVHLVYLASDDVYFVSAVNDSYTNIVARTSTTSLIYSSIVAGDDTGSSPHLEFLIYERHIKNEKGKFESMLVPCLEYQNVNSTERDFKVLCEFPMFKDNNVIDYAHRLGFQVNEQKADFFTNRFGEVETIPNFTTYRKNGVELSETY